jgi:hypothetical protein
MLQKQQAIILNPNDQASAKQVTILQQVRVIVSFSSSMLRSLSLHRTSMRRYLDKAERSRARRQKKREKERKKRAKTKEKENG